MMRVKEHTIIAIRIYAGELQSNTGRAITDDDALWHLLSEYRPDIVKRAEEIQKSEAKPKPKK